jgi:GntP family gluconate:H+ symporter
MSDIAVLINTAVAVLAAVVLIVRFRVNPVIALVIGSVYLGLAAGLGVEKTVKTITSGFGEIMVDVGLLIAFGVLMGSILNQSGAIRRLVEHLLDTFGPKRLPYTMGLAIGTVLQSIFLDVLLVISAPLARKLAPKIGKLGTARMATAMAIALECGIVFTVPGVASLALAGLLNVPLGKMLLFGLLLVVPTIIISIAIMTFLFRRGFWNEAKDEDHTFVEEEDREGEEEYDGGTRPAAGQPQGSGPGSGAAGAQPGRGTVTVTVAERERKQAPLILLFAPLLTSLLLIGAGAILQILNIDMPWLQLLGEPVIALLIGLIGTCLVTRAAIGQDRVEQAITVGFKESGQILILTGVGGSLAATVAAAGLGDILGGFFSASTVAPLLVVWASRGAAHRRRLRHAVRHHRGRAAGPDCSGHRAGPRAPGPFRRRRIPLHGSRHQQHVLAPAVPAGAECEGRPEIRHCRSLGGLRSRYAPDPAYEPVVLTGPSPSVQTHANERRMT